MQRIIKKSIIKDISISIDKRHGQTQLTIFFYKTRRMVIEAICLILFTAMMTIGIWELFKAMAGGK